MRRKTALMAGASLLMVVGLSACGQQQQEQPIRVVNAAAEPTPTSDKHDLIMDQLDNIEGKVDHLAPVTKTRTKTTTTTKTVTQTATVTAKPKPPSTSTTSTPPPTTTPPTTTPEPLPGAQTLGVGGVATPPGALDLPAPLNGIHTIKTAGVYDCKAATVARIDIRTSNVTVQNCKVVANSQYGIFSEGNNNTIQNNDIKGLKGTGDGDQNAITFFGNDTKIQWNTAIDFVATPGDSHTDFIQTWVSTSHPTASSNVVIRSNKATGPANPNRLNSVPSIHQWLMIEDYKRGGNSGGSSSGMKNWLVIGNTSGASWNQDIKNDGVDNLVVTKNDFVGSSSHVMEQANGTGLKFYSDNKIGSGYGNVGVPITAGAGPV